MPSFEPPQLTPHFTFRWWIRNSLHAMAYSKQSHSWHLCRHVGGLCSWGRRLSLMEFKGGVAVRKPHATVMASCCVSRLHFSGTDCVYAIYSLRLHYYNTRHSWKGRRKNTSQSHCNNYLDDLKSLSLFYIRKTSPLQLCSLYILSGFLISYLRRNMLLHILMLMFSKKSCSKCEILPQTFIDWNKIFLSNFCLVFSDKNVEYVTTILVFYPILLRNTPGSLSSSSLLLLSICHWRSF